MKPTDRIKKAIDDLGEHFDAVQILATTYEGGSTSYYFDGCGNSLTRRALADLYCDQSKADVQAEAISEHITPPDGGDGWKES